MTTPESQATWTHRAVLIGVGVTIITEDGQSTATDRSLKGAVQDVHDVKEYLTKCATPVKITTLTATKSPEEDSHNAPMEATKDLPTFDNVCNILEEVIEEGKKGQSKFVYIHYSGHGTRLPNHERPDSKPLALALYDPGPLGTRYLRGTEFANALKQMVRLGMQVTVVLDCCFSGSVLRKQEMRPIDIRFLEYNPAVEAGCVSDKRFVDEPQENMRNADYEPDWLLDPNGYTVITACGLNETAWELEFRKEECRRGVLSYFLYSSLRMLRQSRARVTHETLYRNLRAKFHAYCPQQTPMRYGSTSFSFFEELTDDPGIPSVPVFRNREDHRLILTAGHAHGVHENDEYDVYPFYASESAKAISKQKPVRCYVRTVGGVTSELVAADPANAKRIVGGSAWKAIPRTSFSPRKVPVRLNPCLSNLDREQLTKDTKMHPFLSLSAKEGKGQPSIFGIILNDDGAYEIQDGAGNKIPGLPTFPLSTENPRHALLATLGHLAAFKFFEGVDNNQPNGEFESSFLLEADRDVGQDGWFEVKHGDRFNLTFRNLSDNTRYLAVFNFRPFWEVHNMVWKANAGEFLEIPAREKLGSVLPLSLEMEIPQQIQESQQQCEDIIKVFITSEPTSFPRMVLPGLDDGGVRGNTDRLVEFSNRLTYGVRGTRDSHLQGNWATQNLLIRTSM